MISLIPRFRGAFYLVLYAMDDYMLLASSFFTIGKIKCRIWQLQKSEFGKGPFESKKFRKRPFAAEILPTSQ